MNFLYNRTRFFCFFLHVLAVHFVFSFRDKHDKCEMWAELNQCYDSEYAGFMLFSCHKSCSFLEDLDPLCGIYAEIGRCATDLNQFEILLQCPESCGYTYQWNNYARKRMGIKEIPIEKEPPLERSLQIKSTEGKHNRVKIFREAAIDLYDALMAHFAGDNSMPVLNPNACPSEYHTVMGLGKTLLAATRSATMVLEAVINTQGKSKEVLSFVDKVKVIDADLDVLLGSGDTDALQQKLWHFSSKLTPVIKFISEVELPEESSSQESSTEASTEADLKPSVTLSNGVELPLLGFGTWKLDGYKCTKAVKTALLKGYRRIDTTQNFGNEKEIAKGIKKSGVPREEIFLSHQLSHVEDLGYEGTLKLVEQQLNDLNTTYIDLYLLDQSVLRQTEYDVGPDATLKGAWQALEDLYKEGIIKALGFSNTDAVHMEQFKKDNPDMMPPMVLQNKFNIYLHGNQFNLDGTDYPEFCRDNDMVLVGYGGLSAWPFALVPTEDAHVRHLAARLGKTPSQVALRWQIQQGVAAISKSTNPDHMEENLDLFDFTLSNEEMDTLSSLSWLIATDAHQTTTDNVLDIEGSRERDEL